jgi:anti-sigma factor RsiW
VPRLVLVDDNGRELGAADVSPENVEIVAAFLQRHIGAFRSFARLVQMYRRGMGQLEDLIPAPAPARRRARARGRG